MNTVDPAIFEGRYSFTMSNIGMEPLFRVGQTI